MTERTRVTRILTTLAETYPDARCSLDFRSPLELLVATILSAQCRDALVNKITPALFAKYRTALDYAKASLAELEGDVSRVNFYRSKARSIKLACQAIVEQFGGRVPRTMEELVSLRGVARKTANVVLGNAYGIPSGVVVDTHVMRVSQRLKLTARTDRDKIEQDLMRLVAQKHWTAFAHRVIQHGRQLCKAQNPLCARCPLGQALCPSYQRV